MKVVLDTNVLISGVFFAGLPSRILEAWRDGRVNLVISPAILEEYRRVGEKLAARFEGITVESYL
jgi:putative PIN family toxin of toxin-antitoxin system